MKTNMIKYSLFVVGLLSFTTMSAQTKTDSTVAVLKIKEVTQRIASLEKQIAAADQKRNTVVSGVAPETLEAMNDRQDSICLSLRSQLVSAQLELKELIPSKPEPTPAQTYSGLIQTLQSNAQQQSSQQSTTTPAKPTKPTTPAKPTKPTKPTTPAKPTKPTKK